jgi:DNA-binding response OmpR family regulator
MDEKPLAFVVDDDIDLAFIFTEAVSSAGYQVETFHNGKDVLDRLNEAVPSLLVLDLHLPGITGPDIYKQIRADSRLSNLRVIIASADERLADQFRDHAALVLLKPISMIQLRDLAKRLLKRPSIS